MEVDQPDLGENPSRGPKGRLRVLTQDQVRQIDAILTEMGPFGEVRLVIEEGRLHSIRTLESESLLPPHHREDG